MSTLLPTFTIHYAQYTILRFDKKLQLDTWSGNYDGHIVSFLFTICNYFYNENMSISFTINHLEIEINIEKP